MPSVSSGVYSGCSGYTVSVRVIANIILCGRLLDDLNLIFYRTGVR